MSKLKYFSTFTGVGGLDRGLEELGAECVGYSEIRASSIKIYSRRYPKHILMGDITKLVPKELPDFDVFVGGFPCQAFSMAGARKGFKDRRGQMIFFIHDIIKEKKPKYVVLENVKGILNHNGGETCRNVVAMLQMAGYYVRIVHLVASHYGSAQARERIIFICRRGEDFEKVPPEVKDASKRFRDIRDVTGPYKFLSPVALARVARDPSGFIFLGGYDKVNTVTTGPSSSGRKTIVVEHTDGRLRYLTALEGERLQGFPDGWTDAENSSADRWFAIGNAVNMDMSRYLFTDYLKKLWKL